MPAPIVGITTHSSHSPFRAELDKLLEKIFSAVSSAGGFLLAIPPGLKGTRLRRSSALGSSAIFFCRVRRLNLKINASWDLPFTPRGTWRRFLGGWRLSGIWQYMTGMCFTPQFSSTGGLSNNRPDVVPGVEANLPRGRRSPQRWFNPAAFRNSAERK